MEMMCFAVEDGRDGLWGGGGGSLYFHFLFLQTAVEVAESMSRVVVSHGSVAEERSVQELDIAAEEVLKLSPL